MKFWKKQTDYIIFGLILILLTACSTITKKPDMLSVQSMNNFRKKITKKINVNYLLFLPEGYQDGGKDFPLITGQYSPVQSLLYLDIRTGIADPIRIRK